MFAVAVAIMSTPAAWYCYTRFYRRQLARQCARSAAFMFITAALAVWVSLSGLGGIMAGLVIVSNRALSFRDWYPIVVLVPDAALFMLLIAALIPRVLVSLIGGPDPTVPVRFFVDLYGVDWRRAHGDPTAEYQAVWRLDYWLAHHGQGDWLAEPANPVRAYLSAALDAPHDLPKRRAAIIELFTTNRPFDMGYWARSRSWPGQLPA